MFNLAIVTLDGVGDETPDDEVLQASPHVALIPLIIAETSWLRSQNSALTKVMKNIATPLP